MGDLLQPWHLLVLSLVFFLPLLIVPFWFICKKAGFPPALSFLNLVPGGLGTIVLLYVLAFAPWKPAPPSA